MASEYASAEMAGESVAGGDSGADMAAGGGVAGGDIGADVAAGGDAAVSAARIPASAAAVGGARFTMNGVILEALSCCWCSCSAPSNDTLAEPSARELFHEREGHA